MSLPALLLAALLASSQASSSPPTEVHLRPARGYPRVRHGHRTIKVPDDDYDLITRPVLVTNADVRAAHAALSSKASGLPSSSPCAPSQPCWPTPAQWSALNVTVHGRLLSVLPEGAPCYSDPSGQACADVVGNWTDPFWRASQPGAMQDPYWESNTTTAVSCFNPDVPTCSQGDVPPFAVAAQSSADVAAALAFARKHGLAVAVKSSGHDYQGRSTAGNALLVWTHTIRGFSVNKAFTTACAGDTPRPAVTTSPGNSYGELYDALSPAYTLVGGSARTVSSAGGHVLAGGHSYASPAYGLAADNALAFTAVLANGTVVSASPCSHADLFWALRGGGGGSFAVVTSVTHALHPSQPEGVTGLTLEVLLLNGAQSAAVFMTGFLNFTPGFLDPAASLGSVWSGYWTLEPVSATQFVFAASFLYNGTADKAASSAGAFGDWIGSIPTEFQVLVANYTPFPTMNAWHDAIDSAESGDRTGVSVTLGSRLVPLADCLNETLRINASVILATVASYVPLNGMMVAGAAVAAADPDSTATSVTPAWRAAAQHVAFGAGFASNATAGDIASTFAAVSSLTAVFRSTWPASGAYFNEADFLEPAFAETFWGASNFARLQRVKSEYDPAGVFSCWHCVPAPPAAGGA
jgi:FAD/FMN-containing dehydrogenase